MNPKAEGIEPKGVLVAAFEAGRVALILRGKRTFHGFWSLPGGSREPNETPEQAARRELLEETGLKAETLIHMGLVELSSARNQRSKRLIESFGPVALLSAARVSGSLRGGGDALDAAWFSRGDFVEAKAIPKTLDLVEQAARRIKILF